MKNRSAILAITLMSISTFASQVPANKLESYKQATNLALARAQLKCKFTPATVKWRDRATDAEALNYIVTEATSAVLNDSQAQPVLTFNYDGDDLRQSVAITTTADFRSIVSVDFSQYSLSSEQVNLGTIVNPNIITPIVMSNQVSVSCK